MTDEERPYIETCSFCGDGMIRFQRCETCDRIVALCDVCERMWEDIPAVSHDPNLSSDSSYPQCPACGQQEAEFVGVTMLEIEENELDKFSAGESIWRE